MDSYSSYPCNFSKVFPSGKVLSVYDFKKPSCSLPSLPLVATLVYNTFKMVYSVRRLAIPICLELQVLPRCGNFGPKTGKSQAFPGGSVVKNLPAKAGDARFIPGLERSHVLQRNWSRGAPTTEPVLWSQVAAITEATNHSYWGRHPAPARCSKRRHRNEKPTYATREWRLLTAAREKTPRSNEDPAQPQIVKWKSWAYGWGGPLRTRWSPRTAR